MYLKTTPPRSGLTWKPMCKIFTYIGLKWIPIRKSVETCYNTNDSASPLRKKTHNPNTAICANSSSLSAGTSMASEPISSKGSSNVKVQVQGVGGRSSPTKDVKPNTTVANEESSESDGSSHKSSNEEPSKPEPVQKVSRSIRDVYSKKPGLTLRINSKFLTQRQENVLITELVSKLGTMKFLMNSKNTCKYLVIFFHLQPTAAFCSSSLNIISAASSNNINLHQQQ
nr:hypothetical protein [Tanacetum cinerariifolium]